MKRARDSQGGRGQGRWERCRKASRLVLAIVFTFGILFSEASSVSLVLSLRDRQSAPSDCPCDGWIAVPCVWLQSFGSLQPGRLSAPSQERRLGELLRGSHSR